MLKLAKERDEIRVVNDEILTPTYTVDIANQIVRLMDSDVYGLYHATAQGSCSWYQFAAKIFEFTGTKIRLNVAGPGEFPTKVPRPKYSVLENRSLHNLGLDIMPPWEIGLKRYLDAAGLL
jgi:dTDP-4-dehydrorhamnose reductase